MMASQRRTHANARFMDAWANYCESPVRDNVVALKRSA
jgi:hypothetical protein